MRAAAAPRVGRRRRRHPLLPPPSFSAKFADAEETKSASDGKLDSLIPKPSLFLRLPAGVEQEFLPPLKRFFSSWGAQAKTLSSLPRRTRRSEKSDDSGCAANVFAASNAIAGDVIEWPTKRRGAEWFFDDDKGSGRSRTELHLAPNVNGCSFIAGDHAQFGES